MKPLTVVIVGGGFSAVQFAKTLRRKVKASECEMFLFNHENHMVFHPLLADVAGASINSDAAATPLRQMLPGVECRTERVQRVNLPSAEIEFDDGSGVLKRMHYDHIVIACGAESDLGVIPGMTEHAFGFKVLRDALDLRQHVVRQMEQAEASSDPDVRRWLLSFIVVGAGFSGVEVAGEINELVRSSTRFYQNFKKETVSVTLVHSRDRILPEVAPALAEVARKKMEKAGITILLKERAVAATHEGVELQSGKMLRGGTKVCTIGTATSSLVEHLDVPKERGRIRTAADMRIEGQVNAWAIGDCALIVNAFDNKPSPTTAQFAERQGRQVALNLVRLLKGQPTQPFRFKALGQLCSIGGYQAVDEILGFRISGFAAWLLWRSVYLFKLPTVSRRMKVALDWTWDLLFPRDLGFLNTDATKTFIHSYFRPGDFIQRQGEFARFFTVIEEGEVEVLHATAQNSAPTVLSVLGKGDFFGETALLEGRPHDASVRARTAVRVRQIGSALFSEIAGTFAPFREVLSKGIIRRSGDFWNLLPQARSVLERLPLRTLLDALPSESLYKDTPLGAAITALNKNPTGELVVIDEAQHLWGTLDRNDLHQIVARVAVIPVDKKGNIYERKLSDFISENPLYLTVEDSTLTAQTTMIHHGISWLPVVKSAEDPRPVALLRADTIASRVIQEIGQAETLHLLPSK